VAHDLRFREAENLVTLVLISQNALDAKLLPALMAKGLDWLNIGDVSVAELGNQPKLVH